MNKSLRCVVALVFILTLATLHASYCFRTSVGFIPIMDGIGLYPSGQNVDTAATIADGQARATLLHARSKLVLMSVGMSNTNQMFEKFRRVEQKTVDKAANLLIVNGATGKQVAFQWADPNDDAYDFADEKLGWQGATPADVGVLWVMVTNAANGTYDYWRQTVKDDIRQSYITLLTHYPNVTLIFFSSMTYGGYNAPIGGLHPEPHSYQHGLVMRELLTEHIDGTLLPQMWFGWGTYLWADGLTPRSDGFTWACTDVQNDGCHPSDAGVTKVQGLLSTFFRTDPVAKIWFLGGPGDPPPPPPPPPRDPPPASRTAL